MMWYILKAYQVYEILKERGLLRWGKNGASETLNRPPEPGHPDEVWHVDLMYLYVHSPRPRGQAAMVLSCRYYRRLQPFHGTLESESDNGGRDSDYDSSGRSGEA